MAEPAKIDVVKEAMVSRGNALGGSPEERRANEIYKKVREAGWRAGAKEAASGPIKSHKSKVEMIGSERDSVTGVKVRNPGTSEARRYKEADDAGNVAHEFAQVKEYDKITDLNVKRNLREAVIAEALDRDDIGDKIRAMSDPQRDLWAERILRDPRMAAQVRILYNGVIDKGVTFTETDQAEEDLKTAEIDRQEKQAERDDAVRKIGDINTSLSEFNRPAGGIMGRKAQELFDIDTNITTIRSDLATAKQQEEQASRRLRLLEAEITARGPGARPVATINAEIGTVTGELNTAKTRMNSEQAKLDRKKALEDEEKQLREQKTTLEKEKREKETAFSKAQAIETRKRNVLQQRKEFRESEEENMVSEFKAIVGEATSQCLDTDVEALDKKWEDDAKELATQTNDQNKKALTNALASEYIGAVKKRGIIFKKTYRPLNKGRIREDYDLLMDPDGGPEQVMIKLLMSRVNPASATRAKYNFAEARAIVLDPEFNKAMQPEVVKQLLGRKILVDGISPEDHHIITSSSWGEGMVKEAIANNQQFKKEVEEAMGAGAFDKPGFWWRFGGEIKKHPWWILFALAGGVGAPLMWGVGAARNQGTSMSGTRI